MHVQLLLLLLLLLLVVVGVFHVAGSHGSRYVVHS